MRLYEVKKRRQSKQRYLNFTRGGTKNKSFISYTWKQKGIRGRIGRTISKNNRHKLSKGEEFLCKVIYKLIIKKNNP